MRKKLYSLVKDKLLSIVDASGENIIKHVDLYNSQMAYIVEEQPFPTPAVFIEFSEINYLHQLHGINEADVSIRLHVITDSRLAHWEDAVNVFDLLSQINVALFGLSSNEGIGAFTLSNSITDSNFDELQHNIETYITHITDYSVPNPTKWILVTGYWNDLNNFKDSVFWKDNENSLSQTKIKLNLKPHRLWLLATGKWG